MTAVSIRLPDDVAERLQNLADATGRSKSFYMLEAITEQLDNLEDIYLAERELELLRAGKSHTTPLAEVMQSYGMES